MAKPMLDDEPWPPIQSLLPSPKPRRMRYPGCKRLDDRAVLTSILSVLRFRILQEMLPQEMDRGAGMNCRRRLHDWQQADWLTGATIPPGESPGH